MAYYCIHTLVALSHIWFQLMPHNDNYLDNILRQRLHPAGKGSGDKNITRYKSNYLHHVGTQYAIWCIRAPVRPPSKISTAVKTACERIAPSKSFLGAIYNRGWLYSDYILYWAPLVTTSAELSVRHISRSVETLWHRRYWSAWTHRHLYVANTVNYKVVFQS